MIYHSSENKEYYFPPLLSNGEISFAPDAEGMLGYSAEDFLKKRMYTFDGIVVRVARRTGLCSNLQAKLFPFGKFIFQEGSALSDWSQTLKKENGMFESDCIYSDGAKIHSCGFIHPSLNIYALQKTFIGIKGHKKVGYKITLCGYSNEISKYMEILYARLQDNVCRIGFKMYGTEVFKGEINIFVDKDFTFEALEDGVQIYFDVHNNESVSLFYYLEDDMSGVDFTEVLNNYKNKIDISGFDGLMAECKQHYADFYSLGYVKTSDEKLNSIYKTALYGIKCNTTQYSIAVGLNNNTWDGRYFAFDEYTSFLGLLSSNRLSLAKRVPFYRLNKCLDSAIRRASDCHKTEYSEDMARFHWETGENDYAELSPDGNWLDHIFHISLIGIGAFEFFEYSEDKEFLSECYRMIKACSKFMTKHMVYKDGDKLYVGKCTDLERLGASVQNPFMTACGVIKLLQCCAKAAAVLNVDEEYAEECVCTANKLYENLPEEDNRYVPHLECKQKSIAVFGGKFPFNVLENDNKKMIAAWEDFENNGAAYGNMYPTGKGISPWYACWKALGYARIHNSEKAYGAIKQAYASVGVFDEMFEINEEEYHCRPWFTTACGVFVAAVNESLLQSDGKTIHILPAFPHDSNVAFKLAAKGGITVEVEVENGVLKKAVALKNNRDVSEQFDFKF